MKRSDTRTAQLTQNRIFAIHGVPGLMTSYHRHNDIEINFLERGAMSYLFSRGHCEVPEGTFAVFWAMFPHRVIKIDPDTLFYCLHIPLSTFLQWRLPGEIVGEVLHGNIVVDQTPSTAAADYAHFPVWYDELSEGEPERMDTVHLEVAARMRRAGLSMRRGSGPGASIGLSSGESGADKLGMMTAFVAERYTEDVTPGDVAEHVGLHPKYAMTLFRKAFDMTVVEYVTQLRVSHAQRLLATTDMKIVSLAMEAGFGSVSQFYEAFARVAKCTPSEFRSELRGSGLA